MRIYTYLILLIIFLSCSNPYSSSLDEHYKSYPAPPVSMLDGMWTGSYAGTYYSGIGWDSYTFYAYTFEINNIFEYYFTTEKYGITTATVAIDYKWKLENGVYYKKRLLYADENVPDDQTTAKWEVFNIGYKNADTLRINSVDFTKYKK